LQVKTGEEDEDKLFGERAKLFRFDPETKQWKDRGIGEMKILKHKVTKRTRILMRREQVRTYFFTITAPNLFIKMNERRVFTSLSMHC